MPDSPFSWPERTPPIPLPPDVVHVWAMDLNLPEALQDRLRALLAPDELAREARFRFPQDRRRFALARGALRLLIGGYLRVDPTGLRFGYERFERPFLESPPAGRRLRFNLSHAREIALLAFAWDRQVGVDVERQDRKVELENISARFLAPGERAVVDALRDDQRRSAFFNAWTRKEAYMKARGLGIALPMDRFEVTLAPGEPARLLADATDPAAPQRWQLTALDGLPGYTAALAVEGQGWQLACFRLLPDAEHL